MEIKKGYKMTDVGVIPEDWEVKSIGEICCDSKYGVAAEAIPFDGSNKYIRITDIDDEDGHFVQSNLTSPSFFMPIHILGENDLLVARTGASVGKSYLYNKQDGKLIFAGFLMKFNINRANPKLIFYKTTTSDYHDYIESESMRSGQPGVNIQQIKDYAISLPSSIKEQQAIADALTKVDNLIMSLSKVIEKKKLIKKGTMQKLLSDEVRLDGFEGEWELQTIKDIAVVEKGELLISSQFENGNIEVWAGGKIPAGYHNVANRMKKTITISASGAYAGFVSYHDRPIYATDCSSISESTVYDIKFLYYCLINMQDKIYEMQTGGAQPHVHPKDIYQIELTFPPTKSEQTAIANVLTTMDDEIEKLEKERDKYKSIKQGMMQQLLTGKIRLVCQ